MASPDAFAALMDRVHVLFAPSLIAVVVLATLSILLQKWRARLRGRRGEAKVQRFLKRRFQAQRTDLYLRVGGGGVTQVDHVALTPKGILVVETKNYSGVIRGKGGYTHWDQRVGGKTHQLYSPLRQNSGHIRAVRQALRHTHPSVPVLGYVVFVGSARLRLHDAEGVGTLRAFKRFCATLQKGQVPSEFASAWAALESQFRDDADTRKSHLKALKRRRGAFA